MKSSSSRLTRVIAGITFLALAVWEAITLIPEFGDYYLFYQISVPALILFFLLTAVGLFANQKALTAIGIIGQILFELSSALFSIIMDYPDFETSSFVFVVDELLSAVALLLVLFAVFGITKQKLLLGLFSAVLIIFSFVVFESVFAYYEYYSATVVFDLLADVTISSVLHACLHAAAVLLTCLGGFLPSHVVSTPMLSSSPTEFNISNKLERLTKLKDLLDKGVISQAEFDSKKSQLMKQ